MARKHGICRATYFNRRSKYSEVTGLRAQAIEGTRVGVREAQASAGEDGAGERDDQERAVPIRVKLFAKW